MFDFELTHKIAVPQNLSHSNIISRLQIVKFTMFIAKVIISNYFFTST